MLNHVMAVVTGTSSGSTLVSHLRKLSGIGGAKITLLRLFGAASDKSRSTRVVDPLDWHLRKMEGEAALNSMADQLRESGLHVSTTVLDGADAEQLNQYCESNGVDLMLLSRSQNALDDFAHAIMRRTTTPIMLLPNEAENQNEPDVSVGYQRILLPLDGSQRAEITLPIAAALASDPKPQFLVTHIVRKPEMPRHAPPNSEETELVDRIVELNRADAGRYLEHFAARLPGDVQTRLLVSDNIAATLHQLADEENVDLIILSAHGYSGEPRWPYGSIASNILNYSSKPVLVIQDLPAVEPGRAGAMPVARMVYRRAR